MSSTSFLHGSPAAQGCRGSHRPPVPVPELEERSVHGPVEALFGAAGARRGRPPPARRRRPVQGSLVPSELKAAVCRRGGGGGAGDEVEARRPARRAAARGGRAGVWGPRWEAPIARDSSANLRVHLKWEFI